MQALAAPYWGIAPSTKCLLLGFGARDRLFCSDDLNAGQAWLAAARADAQADLLAATNDRQTDGPGPPFTINHRDSRDGRTRPRPAHRTRHRLQTFTRHVRNLADHIARAT
jgi:hypothetical protein